MGCHNWTDEEMILAADLADDNQWRGVRANTEAVVRLSRLLRASALHPVVDRSGNFRSPSSVGMKVNNLVAWHPKNEGKGLRKSAAEGPIVEEFLAGRRRMKVQAQEIRRRLADSRP